MSTTPGRNDPPRDHGAVSPGGTRPVPTCRTTITREGDHAFRIAVVGRLGSGTFFARSWTGATHVARRYARLLDAPCRVI